jgi:AbrB family looped-hinge helix DNA binding protein
MVADVSVVGERGQITIPKNVRESLGLFPKDSVLVKVSGGKAVLEKFEDKNKQDEQLKEYYLRYAKEHKKIAKEFESTLGDLDW